MGRRAIDVLTALNIWVEICKKERDDDNKDPGERPLLGIIVGAGLCLCIDHV
jgi:hypothetical protein